jgi:quinolinate synthase
MTAICLYPRKVTLISKKKLGEASSSAWAQGGIAAAVGNDDSPKIHFEDTIKASSGLSDEKIVKIIPWHGTCMVHEQFTAEELNQLRKSYPDLVIVSHPECPPDVIKASDFTGSTSGMIQYVKNNKPKNVFLVTECSMSDNVQVENPETNFVRPCNLCPHMKRIQLPKIYDCLMNETNEVLIDKSIIDKARLPIERMIKVGRQSSLA